MRIRSSAISGNISTTGSMSTTGNITSSGNVTTGGFFLGNGSQLSGLPVSYGNTQVASYLPTYSGNVGALTITGNTTLTDSIRVTNTLQFNSGYGSIATAYGVRAWVKHTGGVTVQGSGGLTSITYHGTGDYTYNFNFTMPDANYSTVAQGSGEVSTYHTVPHLWYLRNTYSTTACSIGWFNVTNSGGRSNHAIGCVHWVR